MSDPIVDPADLATYLNDANLNEDRAVLMIRLAQAKCESVVSPLPATAVTVVIDVAARGYLSTKQARGRQMQDGGSIYAESGGMQGGIWLTRDNQAELRRLVNSSGGAFSIDLLPAGYRVPSQAGYDGFDVITDVPAEAQTTATDALPPRVVTSSTDVSPGETIWVVASDGQHIVLTILHEPAGASCKVKRYDQSSGTVTLVPQVGLIDTFTQRALAPMEAFELISDGQNFALF